MSADLSGKVSIITGASSGLGQATAILFARKGALITLCGRDPERLQETLDKCTQASGGYQDRFITLLGDLNDSKVRKDTVSKTIQKFGCLDILVASAGVFLATDNYRDATEETFDNMINTNVKSVFFLVQQAVPHLEKTKGTIISVSSISSKLATSNILYSMSKAAVDHMTRCLALDLGPKKIRVNAVNPSFIASRIRRDYPGNLDDVLREATEKEKTRQPMGECGTPDDISHAILFLASDDAKFISGECLLVDGARSLVGRTLRPTGAKSEVK